MLELDMIMKSTFFVCLVFILLCAACTSAAKKSLIKDKIVSVQVHGIVRNPGTYRVATNLTFIYLLNIAGGVERRKHSEEARLVHGIQVIRTLEDGSRLFYLWDDLKQKREGRWKLLLDNDEIVFHPGPENVN